MGKEHIPSRPQIIVVRPRLALSFMFLGAIMHICRNVARFFPGLIRSCSFNAKHGMGMRIWG